MSGNTSSGREAPQKSPWTHLIAGGGAGLAESCICHPLDTVKKRLGPFGTAVSIARREGFFALYKGIGPVVTAIVPKMAIRFSSFELFKDHMRDPETGKVSTRQTFVAGLGAGITESVVVMNPMEVIKIRLQAQRHSLADPTDIPKYRSAPHAALAILKEEGPRAFYKGVFLTAARQATNQAVNFTLYQEFKRELQKRQRLDELPSWQHLLAGGISGAVAPVVNSPIDVVKTRVQKQIDLPGVSSYARTRDVFLSVVRKEGVRAFYSGLTPRLMRIAPGQAITFMVYEKIQSFISYRELQEISMQE